MSENGWIREKTVLPGGEIASSMYVQGKNWQLYTVEGGGYLLLVTQTLHMKWLARDLVEDGIMFPVAEDLFGITAASGELISSVEYGPFPRSGSDALRFGSALKESMEQTRVSLMDGLYISVLNRILPTFCDSGATDADKLLGRWICGGMNVGLTDSTRISKYARWLSDLQRRTLMEMFDLKEAHGDGTVLSMPNSIDTTWQKQKGDSSIRDVPAGRLPRKERQPGMFTLPGRPALEKFFREEILDIIDREEEYKRFGVGFPGATLFYGPSGSGKTYAVEKFADYLGWPVLRITSGTVGSRYIHETSQLVSRMFDSAIENAPSVLVVDEMEAFMSSRDLSSGNKDIHLEEVAEFLRRIPDAADNHVLLFGMTNMYKTIDKAILRRGRFDHIMEVGMPSKEEVLAVLETSLKDIPTEGNLRLERIAGRLKGRPLSDVAYVVTQAGRISVHAGKKAITAEILAEACDSLAPEEKSKARIGFSL